MKDTEVAVFAHTAKQTRHYHKLATESYEVLEGVMAIEVEGDEYTLNVGDMIVVKPGAFHEVKKDRSEFLCRVVSVNCAGAADRYEQ